MKKFKQGQTVYSIDRGLCFNPPRPYISKWFLHSQKQQLPEEGCMIEKMPVSYVNELSFNPKWPIKFYTSRRKAITELNNIRRSIV